MNRLLRRGGWQTALAASALAASVLAAVGLVAAPAGASGVTAVAELVPAVASGAAMLTGSYPATRPLRLAIGLTTPDQAAETAFLTRLQDPRSPEFHHFLTPAQWAARFGPSAAHEQAVVDWARSAGLTVTARYPNRLVVDVTGTAAAIGRALHLRLNTYRLGSTRFYANDRAPTLPASLAGVVTSIGGLDSFHRMTPAAGRAVAAPAYSPGPAATRVGSGGGNGSRALLAVAEERSALATPRITNGNYDPTDLYSSQAYDLSALYNLGICCNVDPIDYPNGSPPQSSIAIATIGAQAPSDFTGFHNTYPYLAWHYTLNDVDGTPTCCDVEGTQDFEWATAWSNSFGAESATATVNMYDGATDNISTFTDIYEHMVSDDVARVMSTSWSCAEHLGGGYGLTCDPSVTDTQHSIFDSMLGSGWTLLGDSGDQGAYGDCVSLGVRFPASDPDVVAVGGTVLNLSPGPVYDSEVGWSGQTAPGSCGVNHGGSTGGCSSVFSAPSYQAWVDDPCGVGSRAVPDLALNAWRFQNIYFDGQLMDGWGTSIATPELAGLFAIENSYGMFLGSVCGNVGTTPCAPLGQPQPALYAASVGLATANPFYDITSGCNSNDIGPGWCAKAGYDLVTGLGSVNALQLAWALNDLQGTRSTSPRVLFEGPTTGTWYRSDQTVFWVATDSGGNYPAVGVAGYTSGWDAIPTDSFSEPHPGSGDSFYAGPDHPQVDGGSLALSAAGQGCHTVHVRAWDNAGVSSGDDSYGPLCYDTVPPMVTSGPTPTLDAHVRIGPGVPVTLTWAATDATSGVASYTLAESEDGGSYSPVATTTAPSDTLVLTPGHSYQFAVQATDRAGNVSGAAAGRRFTLRLVQESAAAVRYSTGWTAQAVPGASGGSVRYATRKGATTTLTFTGFQVGWVSVTGANRGSATAAVDGGSPTGVNTESSATQPAYVVYTAGRAAGAHRLVITALGTSGHPRVDVDAFVVLS